MGRRGLVPTLVVLAGLALAAPAGASFHLQKVNEVMLASNSGDTSVQFVELFDQGGFYETFPPSPYGPYQLAVFDAAGNPVAGSPHALSATGMAMAASAHKQYLISTAAADTALGVTGDETLDISLPTAAGQACYEATGAAAGSPHAYSCLTWGTITNPVGTNAGGTGSANGAAPPNGQSDQRQPDNSVLAANPTPKAANFVPAGPPPPGGGGGGGGTGGGGGGSGGGPITFAGTGLAAHKAKVDGKGRALLRLTCPAGTNGSCKGSLTLTFSHKKAGKASFNIAASKAATVRVKLSKAALKRLSHRRSRLRVQLKMVAKDGAGTAKTTTGTVTLSR